MIRDEGKYFGEGEPVKNENIALHAELKQVGVQEFLKIVEEFFKPEVISQDVKDEMDKTKSTWSQAFAIKAGNLHKGIGKLIIAMDIVEEGLKNNLHKALLDVLKQHEIDVGVIIEDLKKNESVDENQMSVLLAKLSSQALQIQMHIKNVMNHLKRG